MGKVTNKVNRRLRTPNWSPDEKQYLLELISTRKEVVVTKSNNGPNFSEEKSVAWNEILQELETRFGTKFNGNPIKKVKTQWQNMKRLAREEIAQTGPELSKLTKQTVDVCQILGLLKDGVLVIDPQNNFNETAISTNVEIKTERIDEEMPNSSSTKNNNNSAPVVDSEHNKENVCLNRLESASSASEPASLNDSEVFEDPNQSTSFTKKNASAMTDETYSKDPIKEINSFHKEIQDYFKFISAEKLLKMESIKEERQVIRAMRETAELNKIIAEQKLKHVLWVKKTEMA